MSTQVFMSGLMLGFLLGVLVCYVSLHVLSRRRFRGTKQEIDRLTEDFQELFRQIDKGKNDNS
ncbi:MAG TPA: hypothetical protein VIH59_21715 [Candidatus Tectomicrobia bacterium]|jgi:hypothetical protein